MSLLRGFSRKASGVFVFRQGGVGLSQLVSCGHTHNVWVFLSEDVNQGKNMHGGFLSELPFVSNETREKGCLLLRNLEKCRQTQNA